MKPFNELNRGEQQAYLMLPIIQELKNIGGEGSTKKIKKDIVNNDENLPEDVLTKTRTSDKGNTYHPFNFPYNFAVSNLILAGFLTRPKRGWVVLTKEGRNYSGSAKELSDLVYSRSLPKWAEKSKKSKDKSQAEVSTNEEVDAELTDDIKNNETDDEDDRQRIADAINNLDPYKFELFCRALVNRMHVEMSGKIGVKKSNDGGLDGYGYITTDDFRTTRVAIKKARTGTRVITLIDGDKLVDLVIKCQLHVKKVIKVSYELDDFLSSNE